MKEKQFLELFGKMNVFTTKQVKAHLKGNYAKVYLDRLVKKGSIFRIGRGLYTCHEDPVVYASHISYPSYISFLWSMNYHGATTQVPKLIEVVSRKNGTYPGVRSFKSSYLWGFKRLDYGGMDVFVAEIEKAVIDCIIFEKLPLEDILEALRICDPKTLGLMVTRLRVSDMKRVGYVCELGGIQLRNAERLIQRDRNYIRSVFCSEPNGWRVKAC